MNFEILPTRTAGAAENMALDFLLLQRYPNATAPRFRHYDWRTQAFTFGYSQKIEFVRNALPSHEPFDLCRRPTGGGIVDHRNDWTYALVIPRGHPLEDARATQSYREVHECLAAALQRQAVTAATKKTLDPHDGPGGVCFDRAELYDVVNESTGQKIAGGAQKRNKHGLLFQGSLWRPALGKALDEDKFAGDFSALLAAALGLEPALTPWPELNEDEVAGAIEHYSSPEWVSWR